MHTLTVPGTLDSLSEIADFVKMASATAGLEKKAAYQLRLAVDEVATNIIVHGYEEAGLQGNISLRFELNEKALTVAIEDTGIEFDPNQQLLPDAEDLAQPLEQRQLGGLGIYLVLKGVDEFVYERVGNVNRNTFIMNRSAAAEV